MTVEQEAVMASFTFPEDSKSMALVLGIRFHMHTHKSITLIATRCSTLQCAMAIYNILYQ